MTKRQFKHDLRRGLGSCYIELKKCDSPEKYRDDLMWGCEHAFAYDTQSEGTRSPYLFGLIKLLGDYSDFCEFVAAKAKENIKDYRNRFNHFARFLTLMAEDGSKEADRHVWDLYEWLLNELQTGRHTKRGTWPARDNMSSLCVYILNDMCGNGDDCIRFLLKAFSDYGNVMLKRPSLTVSISDDWLESEAVERLGRERIRELMEENHDDPGINAYLEQWKKNRPLIKKDDVRPEPVLPPAKTAEEIYSGLEGGKRISMMKHMRRLEKENNRGEADKLARMYVNETDEIIRINLLTLFRGKWATRSLDRDCITRLFSDMRSDDSELSELAEEVLTSARDERVRSYAEEILRDDPENEAALNMMLGNYRKGDGDLLIPMIKVPHASEKNDFRHWVYAVFLELIEENKDADDELSDALLPYIYREGNCSNCRRRIVEHMIRRDILTPDIKKECIYDCNEDIHTIL